MSGAVTYLPHPFCDLAVIWSQNQSYRNQVKDADQQRIVVRLALTVTQFYFYYTSRISLPAIACAGIALSLPATSISLGLGLIHMACQKVFQSFPSAAVCFAAGWFLLEKHEVYSLGFLERCLPQHYVPKPLPPADKPSNEEWLEKSQYCPFVYQNPLLDRLLEEWNALGKFGYFEDEEDPDLGVFKYQSIVKHLGTQAVVEFFYCFDDITFDRGRARVQGVKITGKEKQQVYYASFRNTFKLSFLCDGLQWESREHYYQAQKFKQGSETYNKIQKAEGAFRLSQNLSQEVKNPEYEKDLRINSPTGWIKWKSQDSILINIHANLAYFGQHKESRDLLLSTGKLPLVLRNEHPDAWGISFASDDPEWDNADSGRINRNRQGWVLMYLRSHFRNFVSLA